ncbi:MAG: hydrogenase nickel incorporation protein HypB [Bacteroidales bacterium]|nr:hydrogenase nickel incorporation protein HypB [Bacteroidales bacterium]
MCDICGCNEGDSGYVLLKPTGKDGQYSHTHHHGHEQNPAGDDHSHVHSHDHPHDHSHSHDHSHDHPYDHSHSHDHGHDHPHDHSHSHDHSHDHPYDHKNDLTVAPGEQARRIVVETDILHRNDLLAERNRGYFEGRGIIALNLVSSPGSGKTTILEKTVRNLSRPPVFVIEGDQQTTLDAQRINSTGTPVIQVNTGNGCHLDAEMTQKAVKELNPQTNSLLLIENVGNLVCPALFDLGEKYRVVIVSVTEGDDKPLKYPNMFRSSHICIINKIDLLPYVDFNMEQFKKHASRINPDIRFIELSARNGEGFDEWIRWIQEQFDEIQVNGMH